MKAKRYQVREFIDDLDAELFPNYLQLALMHSRQENRLKNMQHQEVEEISKTIKAKDFKQENGEDT